MCFEFNSLVTALQHERAWCMESIRKSVYFQLEMDDSRILVKNLDDVKSGENPVFEYFVNDGEFHLYVHTSFFLPDCWKFADSYASDLSHLDEDGIAFILYNNLYKSPRLYFEDIEGAIDFLKGLWEYDIETDYFIRYEREVEDDVVSEYFIATPYNHTQYITFAETGFNFVLRAADQFEIVDNNGNWCDGERVNEKGLKKLFYETVFEEVEN